MPGNIRHILQEKYIKGNPLPVWIIRSGEITFYSINEAAEKEFWYKEEELLGDSILKICPSFSLNELIISSEVSYYKNIPTKIKRKDGKIQAAKLEVSSFVFENENYFYITVHPIIASKSGKIELTDYFYSHTFSTNPVPVIMMEKKTLRIIQVNDGTIRLYGYSYDEFIGMKYISLLHPEDIDNVIRLFYAIKDNGPNKYEFRQITKSNRIIEAELFIQSIKSFDDEILIMVIHDITDKKLTLKLLENNLNNFRIIANNSNDLILRHTLDGKIKYASMASMKLLGFTPPFLMVNNIFNFIHPADADRLKSGLLTLTESGHFKTRFRIKNSTGRYIWLECITTLLMEYGLSNEPEFLSVSRDISDQVEIENKLAEANEKVREIEKLKHIILANISHELRTPLQSILEHSKSIKERTADISLSNDLDNIYENGQRLLRMINLFLNLSYLESNNFLPRFEVYDIIPIIRNTIDSFNSMALKKNLEFNFYTDKKFLFVNTDKIILRDILDNLIDNAIKFTQSGEVKITAGTKKVGGNEYASLVIEDSGIGIPPWKKVQALQEFRQLSEGLNRNYEGIGLGLSVAKKLTDRINGKMTITGKNEGGTIIEIFLIKEDPD